MNSVNNWGQFPQGPTPAANYAVAKAALDGAGSKLKFMRFAFLASGAVLIALGAVLAIAANLVAGASLLATGVIFIVATFRVLPRFTSVLGTATARINELDQRSQLAATGTPAHAQLLQVQQTGAMVNFNPEVVVLLQVQHPTLGSYRAQTKVVVPQLAIPRMQPGASVPVRISPTNPADVAVVV